MNENELISKSAFSSENSKKVQRKKCFLKAVLVEYDILKYLFGYITIIIRGVREAKRIQMKARFTV